MRFFFWHALVAAANFSRLFFRKQQGRAFRFKSSQSKIALGFSLQSLMQKVIQVEKPPIAMGLTRKYPVAVVNHKLFYYICSIESNLQKAQTFSKFL